MPIFIAKMSGVKMTPTCGADLAGADFRDARIGVNIQNQGMGQIKPTCRMPTWPA
jgi:hypothetical protein